MEELTQEQFEALQAENKALKDENAAMKKAQNDLSAENETLAAENQKLKKAVPSQLPEFSLKGQKYEFTSPRFKLQVEDGHFETITAKEAIDTKVESGSGKAKKVSYPILEELIAIRSGVIRKKKGGS